MRGHGAEGKIWIGGCEGAWLKGRGLVSSG